MCWNRNWCTLSRSVCHCHHQCDRKEISSCQILAACRLIQEQRNVSGPRALPYRAWASKTVWCSDSATYGAVILDKHTFVQLVNKLPAFCGTRKFITLFTRARHRSLSRARWIQSKPSHNIILTSKPTSSEMSLFRLSNQNFARISHLPHVRYMPCPS
jgi:hypothetical protein